LYMARQAMQGKEVLHLFGLRCMHCRGTEKGSGGRDRADDLIV
jgi:hypothetical protein